MLDWLKESVLWLFSGVGVVIVIAIIGFVARRRRPSTPELPASKPTPHVVTPPVQRLKERAHLLVVDDATFEYLGLLRGEDFDIRWKKDLVSTAEIENGSFDIVLLDLHGVGTSLSDQQGIGLLRQIKAVSPAQIVIAYSSAAWTVDQSKQTSIADAVIDKAESGYPEFRTTITNLLLASASVDHYVDVLVSHCPDTAVSDAATRARLQEALLEFCASGDATALNDLERQLRALGAQDDTRSHIQATAQLARKRLSPWLTTN